VAHRASNRSTTANSSSSSSANLGLLSYLLGMSVRAAAACLDLARCDQQEVHLHTVISSSVMQLQKLAGMAVKRAW
jgi:hypothetical protein